MPVYLSSVAAALRRDGHSVTLIERGLLDEPGRAETAAVLLRLADQVRAAHPQLALFDVSLETWPDLHDYAQAVKAAAPGVLVLAGGNHPTLCPEQTLEYCSPLDGVVPGEPENVMLDLARGSPLEETPAIVSRRESRHTGTAGERPVMDLDSLPLPAWDLLDMDYYTRRTPRVIPCLPLRTATVESSRGCTGRCAFCTEGRLNSRIHRFHSPAYLREAIDKLVQDYRVEAIYFSDESFLSDRDRVARLCEEFLRCNMPERVRWSAQTRADTVTPEILSLMRRAGCIQLEFGIESGSQSMLDRVAKGIRVEQNHAALRMTREAGIRSLISIIYGMPGETREDVVRTERFLDEARPDVVRLNAFVLYPGTPLTKTLVDQGILKVDYWKDEEIEPSSAGSAAYNVSAMSLQVLHRAVRKLYVTRVLPRYVSDYLTHNSLSDIIAHFHPKSFFPFLWRRFCR